MARWVHARTQALVFLVGCIGPWTWAGTARAGPRSFCEVMAYFGEARTPVALQAALRKSKLDAHSAPVFGPFDSPSKMIDMVASSRAMADVRTVRFDYIRFSAQTITRLGRSPNASQIRRLSLSDELPTASVLAALSDASVFPNLVRLDILKLGNDPQPRETERQVDALAPAFAALVASGRLRVLTFALDKTSAALVERMLAAKRQSPLLVEIGDTTALSTRMLKRIADLDRDGVIRFKIEVSSTTELARLDRTAFLRRVADLTLDCGDAGARMLARSKNLPSLTHLRLFACSTEGTKMTFASAQALATPSQFPKLRHLAVMNDYEQCQEPGIGPKGLAILLASSLAGQLETLRLGGQKLYEKGVRALVLSDKLSALRRLGIEGDHVSAREMRSLVYGGPLSATLEELSLSGVDEEGGNTLDEQAALVLASTLDMPKLRFLDLSWNRLSEKARSRLRRAPWTKQLEVLKTTDMGSADLEATRPMGWSCADELLVAP